jgi:hypothetical protein
MFKQIFELYAIQKKFWQFFNFCLSVCIFVCFPLTQNVINRFSSDTFCQKSTTTSCVLSFLSSRCDVSKLGSKINLYISV